CYNYFLACCLNFRPSGRHCRGESAFGLCAHSTFILRGSGILPGGRLPTGESIQFVLQSCICSRIATSRLSYNTHNHARPKNYSVLILLHTSMIPVSLPR